MRHRLFDLSGLFTSFFETCPVLKALIQPCVTAGWSCAALTAFALGAGLGSLGIEVPDRM